MRRVPICQLVGDLKGKDLACWCPVGTPDRPVPCHADIWLEVANG